MVRTLPYRVDAVAVVFNVHTDVCIGCALVAAQEEGGGAGLGLILAKFSVMYLLSGLSALVPTKRARRVVHSRPEQGGCNR